MKTSNPRALFVLAAAAAFGAAALPTSAAVPSLTADQVVEKNVAARGGLAAWRGVTSLAWKGKMGAGGTTYAEVVNGKLQTRERPELELPYRLEMKRPNKSRLEIEFQGNKAVQVFDGNTGWKLRPFLGRSDPEPFSTEEVRRIRGEQGIDAYLVDLAGKGATAEMAGTEKVAGRDCYKLKVTTKGTDGVRVRHIWVDSETFLEARIEGDPRRLDGRQHTVSVYPRDFRPENGIVIPHVVETEVRGVGAKEKATIDGVEVNPTLDDARFTKASLVAASPDSGKRAAPVVRPVPAASKPMPAADTAGKKKP